MTKTFISILRGINVGGKRKLPMADLKTIYQQLGFTHIITYIQSGNVVFQSHSNIDQSTIEQHIERAIEQQFGFEVPVMIRTKEDWQQLIHDNPFITDEPNNIDRLHVTFFKTIPTDENQERISTFNDPSDRFLMHPRYAFIYCGGGYSDTKLNNQFFENKLKVSATTRNWKTILKLYELIQMQ